MNTYDALVGELSSIEKKIGYAFQEKSFLLLSLTHRSFSNENRHLKDCHNERLEFLGDAILGLIVSEFLYTHLPDHPEGELSYLRSRLVEAKACALYLQKLDLEKFLLVGKGELMNEGKGRGTLLADLFEALIGAIYLDGGMVKARDFFFNHFKEEVLAMIDKPHRNWKAELQDHCQKIYQKPPEYIIYRQEGPDHLKTFFVRAELDGKVFGEGKGSSKKEAEQEAAQKAMLSLEDAKDG